jgi:hypothetical protein
VVEHLPHKCETLSSNACTTKIKDFSPNWAKFDNHEQLLSVCYLIYFSCEFLLPYSIFLFIIAMGGSTLWHLHKLLQCIKYIIFEFTPSTIYLHLLPAPNSWSNFNRDHFCIYLHVILYVKSYTLYPLWQMYTS